LGMIEPNANRVFGGVQDGTREETME